MGIALIVHGGAGDIPHALQAGHLAGCSAAAEAGWAILARHGSALDAVEAAIRVMEDDPVFNAGRGSHLNRDGEVEMDAGMMDGRTLMAGAVAAVKRVANPITLARRVLSDSEHVFLAASGAERFAEEVGLPLCTQTDLIVPRELRAWEERIASLPPAAPPSAGAARDEVPARTLSAPGDTVGAIAIDACGNLAVGNSTGGTPFKYPGRVGDTPIIGCGLYADNTRGAAACTGWGEQIMKTVLAKTAVDQIALSGSPVIAANVAIAFFRHRVNGSGGVICVSPEGQVGWAHSTPHMAYAYRVEGMPAAIASLRDPKAPA